MRGESVALTDSGSASTMAHPLFKHIPAAEVTAEFKDLASSWPLWESANQPPEEEKDKFHFDYNGDHDSERVLVASGSATLKPDDGSPSVELKPGDAIYLHKGFACSWAVLEPMTTHYGYFDKGMCQDAAHWRLPPVLRPHVSYRAHLACACVFRGKRDPGGGAHMRCVRR